MVLKVYNTLSRKKEVFTPLHGKNVSMYSCGPTVYNYAHIGNLRTYLFNDFLKRSLRFLGYDVKQVMNITDVDDKTIRRSREEKEDLKSFTRKYERIFFEDLKKLHILRPEHVLRATEHIPAMITLIDHLLKKKCAYVASDGVYFSIESSKNYGKLAQLEKVKIKKARVQSDEYDKSNPQDFALWKFHTSEDGEAVWDAPFGKGRPGWHIECSAMSMEVLGEKFDVHTGAVDLIFPHHTNEIAQSECATGKHPFVKYWLHGGFLMMKKGKMAKSVGNVLYLKDLEAKEFSPLAYRYLCLMTHYRSQLQFNFENLEGAKNAYERLKNICRDLKSDGKTNENYLKAFTKALENDMDMPKALAVIWKFVRDFKATGKMQTLKKMDAVLGLELFAEKEENIPANIQKFVEQREEARKKKDWKTSDALREKIKGLGFVIDDTKDGMRVRKS